MTPPRPERAQDLILRDILAIDRTVLANERTLLSYVRTSLALLGGGIGLLKFFDGPLWGAAGVAAIVLGVGVSGLGAARFSIVTTRLRAARSAGAPSATNG